MSYFEANVRLCRYAVHFRALPSGLVSDVPPMWAQDDQREVRSSAEQIEESTHLPAPSRPHTCHYVVRLPSSDPDRAVSGFARIPRLMQFPWPAWLIGIRCSSPPNVTRRVYICGSVFGYPCSRTQPLPTLYLRADMLSSRQRNTKGRAVTVCTSSLHDRCLNPSPC